MTVSCGALRHRAGERYGVAPHCAAPVLSPVPFVPFGQGTQSWTKPARR
jgi:hypothetical protein